MHFIGDMASMQPCRIRRTRRSSSYDRTGANNDFRRIPAGGTAVLLDADGPGIVTHIWFALAHMDYNYLRKMVIRIAWDGNSHYSVNCPLGDFLGVGHAVSHKYQCALTNIVRGEGLRGESTGGNAFFPMPFRKHARVEVVNESHVACMACYYTVNWMEVEPEAVADKGYFHAFWNRENPKRVTPLGENDTYILLGRFGRNATGQDNYKVADIRGCGRFLGMNLSVDNLQNKVADAGVHAFGEGDEMISIDGEVFSSVNGTGTEDYFLDAWGMTGDANLYAGTSLPVTVSGPRRERGTCYRYHVPDPIYFRDSLRFSFENGANNCQANDLSSTAYWYQGEPVGYALQPMKERLPRPDIGDPDLIEEEEAVTRIGKTLDRWYRLFLYGDRRQVRAAGEGICGKTVRECFRVRSEFQNKKIELDEVKVALEPLDEALIKTGADAIPADVDDCTLRGN